MQVSRGSPIIAVIETNPAKLSPGLGCLFPPGALVAELREPGNPSLLLNEEARYIGKAVLKRVQEFAAGRLCARALLSEFGVKDFPVTVADDRQPVWPEALVGSITHTQGLCAAVVAERALLRAVGLDSEVAGGVKAELWPSICTPAEIEWLRSLAESERAIAATLIFSAKEAFYKCQYPLARERLSFQDARVEVFSLGAARGEFKIHATRRIALAAHAELPMRGRYLIHENYLSAGIALASG